MAEPPFFSSQSTESERPENLYDQENVIHTKPRKAPTVTPRRFKHFFTPRASGSAKSRRQSRAARLLRDITRNGHNLRRNTDSLKEPDFGDSEDIDARPLKRRKRSTDVPSSPTFSSPLQRVQPRQQNDLLQEQPLSPLFLDEEADDIFDRNHEVASFPQPISQLRRSGCNARVLQRSWGLYDTSRFTHDHCTDWRSDAANFMSPRQDIHCFSSLPFCTAACHTNSLIAVGDEEGAIRLIDSSTESDFSTAHVSFRPHHNAVMDIAFNSDDYRLATASGDQTARMIDMHTQQTLCILSGHKSSVKQIRFRPNNDHMLTTSSRDGSVLIWDMRCSNKGSIASLHTSFARNVDNGDLEPSVRYAKHTLNAASYHRSISRKSSQRTVSAASDDGPGVSITAFEHVINGREHLLLTTSEHNSAIKIWDLRKVGLRIGEIPFSTTPSPENHRSSRNYGINAMALSGDGARLYTVCRDASVYAYSTNHLALKAEPGTQINVGAKGAAVSTPKLGLGPLYGFRHPNLTTRSFYIKAAVRPTREDQSELLAVGSSDGCAVLFPTDERSFTRTHQKSLAYEDEGDADLPLLPVQGYKDVPTTGIPIHECGTALIRGHAETKELTSLTWSHEGALVSISDDYTARCWRENHNRARYLRSCGEGDGERWDCGWADVDAAWDEEDG